MKVEDRATYYLDSFVVSRSHGHSYWRVGACYAVACLGLVLFVS